LQWLSIICRLARSSKVAVFIYVYIYVYIFGGGQCLAVAVNHLPLGTVL
jgi:hypothetical protein